LIQAVLLFHLIKWHVKGPARHEATPGNEQTRGRDHGELQVNGELPVGRVVKYFYYFYNFVLFRKN
jgi:hypothetical protein